VGGRSSSGRRETAECIPALTEVANSNNNFVNGLARDALKAVQARTKAGG
jgi:hypothetical protein